MSKTLISDIKNNTFSPVVIEEGTFVVWRNLDPYAHSVETLSESSNYFNAGPLLPNEASSPIYFSKAAEIDYLCRFHHEMKGKVKVLKKGENNNHGDHQHDHGSGHDHGHFKHFHGFVTGGSSAKQLFLTHTPVLADPRHHYQIVLQASLPDPQHAAAYDKIRNSSYADGKIQIFHDHIALKDIGDGTITVLPSSSFEYYPNDPRGETGGESIPGLEDNIPVQIDRIMYFHEFEKDIDYPEGITYILYGNEQDVFIDHLINRAPSFHSVAKLKGCPEFYKQSIGDVIKFSIPDKLIRDVSPKVLERVSIVDNAYHLFWLPPTGVYARSLAQDPLINRDKSDPVFEVLLENGNKSKIEIGRFLHFDVRLLNYGVFIV